MYQTYTITLTGEERETVVDLLQERLRHATDPSPVERAIVTRLTQTVPDSARRYA